MNSITFFKIPFVRLCHLNADSATATHLGVFVIRLPKQCLIPSPLSVSMTAAAAISI